MSALNKVRRALLAFDSTSHGWGSISLRNAVHAIAPPVNPRKQTPSLTSFNILASQIGPFGAIERSTRFLDCIFTSNSSTDIIHLQEVSSDVRQLLLDDSRVRAGFLLTDTEEHSGEFCGTPPRCENMTLLSNKRFGSESASSVPVEDGDQGERLTLRSVYHIDSLHMHRNALGVDVAASDSSLVYRLLNLHFDPFRSRLRRFFQIRTLANVLREPEYSGGGVIAGDFDTIFPEEERFFGEHSLVDAWTALHGSAAAVNRRASWGSQSVGRKRVDRVVMLGLKPHQIELIRLSPIERCASLSDRCGLRCTFTI
ncbi:hypothetical protein R3P38DRAFT_1633159 [Favolaschia claudopus]|uniref:Endonuclease/exonuclease/phosphatase domain-containing protein n=1 Tax=Favolaschia claudopus TaxID=2862362 RepID=A0AAW0DGQ6_9AGAR